PYTYTLSLHDALPIYRSEAHPLDEKTPHTKPVAVALCSNLHLLAAAPIQNSRPQNHKRNPLLVLYPDRVFRHSIRPAPNWQEPRDRKSTRLNSSHDQI